MQTLARLLIVAGIAVVVAAQTLPEPSASMRILEKLAFEKFGTVTHPEDGEAWEWRLEAGRRQNRKGDS